MNRHNPKHTSRTDHNILSSHLLLPAHPPLNSCNQPKNLKQYYPRQAFKFPFGFVIYHGLLTKYLKVFCLLYIDVNLYRERQQAYDLMVEYQNLMENLLSVAKYHYLLENYEIFNLIIK